MEERSKHFLTIRKNSFLKFTVASHGEFIQVEYDRKDSN